MARPRGHWSGRFRVDAVNNGDVVTVLSTATALDSSRHAEARSGRLRLSFANDAETPMVGDVIEVRVREERGDD